MREDPDHQFPDFGEAGRMPTLLSSDSLAVQRMALALGVELGNRMMDAVLQVVCSGEGLMSEMVLLQVEPDFFDVVELRGVFRQPFDRQPMRPLGESGACRLAGMDRTVVERQHGRLECHAWLGPVAPVELLEQSDEVGAALGSAGANDQ